MSPSFAWYFYKEDNYPHRNQIIKFLIPFLNISDSELLLVGDRSLIKDYESNLISPCSLLIYLWRQLNFHENDRQTVLSYDEFVISLQLILAERNKKNEGEFYVEASSVIFTLNKFIDKQLNGLEVESDHNLQEIFKQYESFLKTNNLIDVISILATLKKEVLANPKHLEKFYRRKILFIYPFGNKFEVEIVKFLVQAFDGPDGIFKIFQESSLNESFNESINSSTPKLYREKIDKATIITDLLQLSAPNKKCSVTEFHIEKILMSYINLLVNSRNEMALANVVNSSVHEIDHLAFTKIKHEASSRKMSMYQSVLSFVTRIKIGTKASTVLKESPLAPYVKELSSFVDLMNKIQNIIEDERNLRKAISKITHHLGTNLSKNQQFKPEIVKTISESIAKMLNEFIDSPIPVTSPIKQNESKSGVIGKDTIVLLRNMLDFSAGLISGSRPVEILTDEIFTQKTPVRFHNLLNQFRSPLDMNIDEESTLNQELALRIIDQSEDKKTPVCSKRFKSSISWISETATFPSEYETNILTPIHNNNQNISKNAVCAKDNKRKSCILQSINDQENTKLTDVESGSHSVKNKQSKRYDIEQKEDNHKFSLQKQKMEKKTKPKCRRKILPIAKGQKTLNSYFR